MPTAARVWAAALAAVTVACGSQPRLETRTFEIRHLEAGIAGGIIGPYVDRDRPGAPGVINVVGNVISVRETADNLDRIGRVLAEFDRPQPAVRLTFKLIEADGAAVRDTSIADVEAALRSLFRFRGYRLITDAVVTGVQGAEASQTLSGPGVRYLLETRVHRVVGAGDSASVEMRVRLFATRTAGPGDARFETDVRLPLGRTAVLGNLQGDARQPTLILAVQPELVAN